VLGTIIPGAWMVAGLAAWRLRPETKIGMLMVGVGCTYPWNPLAALGGAYVQWFYLMFGGVTGALVAYTALAFPGGVLTRPAVIAALLVCFERLILAPASVAFRAESVVCPACPPNPYPTAGQPALVDFLSALKTPVGIAAWLGIAVVLTHRWRGASAPARRALAPMLWVAVLYALAHFYFFLIGRAGDARPGTLLSFAFALIPLGFLVGLLRTRQHRSVVADLVVQLGSVPEPVALRDLLARTLGDPSLQLAFWLPDRQAYVGADGSPMRLPEPGEQRRVSVIEHEREPLAALVYDPALLEDPKLLEAVTAAARLALENSRLQAELRARLLEVRESRARIVAAGDAERRRIERNLHDGAQQTLLGLRLAVRLARNRADGDAGLLDAQLAEIDAELQGAVEELRTLARGVHPAVLSEEGLQPALEALARRAMIPTLVTCRCPSRLPAPLETAAYYVASEALANVVKHAHATRATIDVSLSDGHAVIEVTDDGRGGADPHGSGLRGLRDRVEALDGTLRIESRDGAGTSVRADVPLA